MSSRACRRTVRPLSIALLCMSLLSGCARDGAGSGPGPGPGPGASPGGPGDKPTPVTTVHLRPEAFTETTSAIGTVKARESVTVTAKVSEIVQRVHFDSGQEVVAGAPLITLSDTQQQAALNEAKAAADEADRLYQRQRELAERQLVSRAQLDNQRAARDAAQARVAQIHAQLADRVIRAPFSGVLGLRQVSPGALVTPGTPIATLDDLARVYVDFPLPEAKLAQVGAGQHIAGRTAAWPQHGFDGTVVTIDARIDAATRSVLVRADFPNPQRLLRPGMLINVELAGRERQALLVPEIAVVQVGRDSFVYRVKADGSVEQVKVEIAARSGGKAEIASGANSGDRIVVEGTGKLRPGAKISEVKPASPTADTTAAPGFGPSASSLPASSMPASSMSAPTPSSPAVDSAARKTG